MNLTWRLYMGLVKELRERKDLTEREESIRKYIFENPERLYDLSARELGEATFSSAAAVTRFCKKIGCKGYPDFRLRFLNEIQNGYECQENKLSTKRKENTASVMEKVANCTINGIKETQKDNSIDRIAKAAKMIHDYEYLDFYGNGLNAEFTEYARFRFAICGKVCNVYNDSNLQIRSTLFPKEGHLSIFISQTGENKQLIELIKLQRERHFKILVITKSKNTTIAKYADHILLISGGKQKWEDIEAMWISKYTSSLKYLIDVLANIEYVSNQAYNRKMDEAYNKIGSTNFWTLTYSWNDNSPNEDK